MKDDELPWSSDVSRLAVSDVLRWSEAIWPERKRARGKGRKAAPWGEQRVTAQLLEVDAKGYLKLRVMKAALTKNEHQMPLKCHAKGNVIVKKRDTIMRGQPQRLPWSDEAQRAIEISSFVT